MNSDFEISRILFAVIVVAVAQSAVAQPAGQVAGEHLPVQTTEAGLKYTSTWFGSTWGGGPKWVQTFISYLAVLPDGTILTHSGWDEAHREATIYSAEGEIVAGVPHSRGRVIGADAKYVYVPVSEETDGERRTGIARYWLRHHLRPLRGHEEMRVTLPAPIGGIAPAEALKLPEGLRWRYDELHGKKRNGNLWLPHPVYHWAEHKRRREIEENPDAADKYRRPPPQIRGIASDGKELFVSEDITHRIHVLDVDTLDVKRSSEFRYPGPLALDDADHLWVVRRPEKSEGKMPGADWLEMGPHAVVQLTREGKPTGKRIADVKVVSDIAFGGPQRRLYVADTHPSRIQVLVYDVGGKKPKRVGALGVAGGVYAPPVPGRTGPDRLDVLSGVGVDAAGNVAVSTRASGSFIRRYSPDGRLCWERYTATFMNGSSFDPKLDGTVVYSGRGAGHRFELDYGRRAGPLDDWVAVTRDPWRFQEDERGYHGTVRRLSNGKLYLATNLHTLGTLILRQEPESEIFVPSVMLSNGHGANKEYPPQRPRDEGGHYARVMWRDFDGDGRMDRDEFVHSDHHQNLTYWKIDSAGDLWEYRDSFKGQREGSGLLRFKLQGFDEHGNPLWDFDLRKAELFPHMKPFPLDGRRYEGATPVQDYYYDAARDRMFLSGYPEGYDGPKGGSVGAVMLCYHHFTDEHARQLAWTLDLPLNPDGKHYHISSFSVAGNLLFAGLGTATKDQSIFVYDARTGKSLGAMVPGPAVHGESSWLDIPQAVNAFRRSNGEVIVCVENNWKNLQTVYRIPRQPLLP